MIGRWKDVDDATMARMLMLVAAAVGFGLALVSTPRGCL
jgi:hypothetical protein